MKCYKGAILSMDSEDSVYRYLVEDNGYIKYVGNELPQEYEKLEVIDLKEGALIPSFVDTHLHFASFSTFFAGLNVMEMKSNVEILQKIDEYVKKNRNKKTIIVFGASPYSVIEKRLISKTELDSVCSDREIMVVKYDGHACIVNSKLLDRLNDKVCHLRGYHPDSGEMNQEAFFEFSNYITNSVSLIELVKNMQMTVDYMAKQGIACINTVSGVGFWNDLDVTLEKLFAKGVKNRFQIRVFPQSMNVDVALKRKLPRIGGCFACALDGCFGSGDAALMEQYMTGGHGVLYYSDDEVIDFCKKANCAGLQIELHAIGDKAFDQACRAIKEALDDYPVSDHRHGIIHACLPTDEGIKICSAYRIQLLMQSSFIDWKQEPDEYLREILGEDRAGALNPINTYLKNDIAIAFGSDAPCTNPDPIDWISKAVNNENSEERITVQEALRMCTYNGYQATFDEEQRGSLEVGKIADMVILSQNPYDISREKLKDINVVKLLLSGVEYSSCRESVIKTVLRGIFSNNKY